MVILWCCVFKLQCEIYRLSYTTTAAAELENAKRLPVYITQRARTHLDSFFIKYVKLC